MYLHMLLDQKIKDGFSYNQFEILYISLKMKYLSFTTLHESAKFAINES